MRPDELTDEQLERIVKIHPGWVAYHRPDWMSDKMPVWMSDYRPQALVNIRPKWVANHHPDLFDKCGVKWEVPAHIKKLL